jgi:hypothetical protein
MLLLIAGCGSNEGGAPAGGENAPTARTKVDGGGAPATETLSGDQKNPVVERQPDGGAWQKFSLPEGGYSVEFPGAGQELPSSEGAISHGVELATGGAYVVMYSDVGVIKPEEIEERLTNVRNEMVGQQEILHDATLTLAGRPVRDFAFVDGEGDAIYYRITVAGTRLYQVMTVTVKSDFDRTKAERERFLASFKLLEAQ